MNEDIGYLKREIAALKSQLQNIESRSRQSWVYAGGGSSPTPVNRLLIQGGNDLATIAGTTYKGIKFSGSTVTSLPSLTPVAGTTYADGLGYGYLVNANGTALSAALVWISNYRLQGDDGVIIQAETNNHVAGNPSQTCFSIYSKTITVSGQKVTVYSLWR